MLEWMNAFFAFFKSVCQWLLKAPFYGNVTVGFLLIALCIVTILFDILVRRFR